MSEHITILEAGRAEKNYWRDLWRYRELFFILAWRDVSVRYKQTVIGVAWAVIRPFLTMIIFTIVFGRVANLPTEGHAPYALLVFAGMLPWTLFARVVRIAPVLLLALAVKTLAGEDPRRHPHRWFWGVLWAWAGFYGFYFQRMGW
jgi:lipopolysaccharide transport system permease protein